MPGEPLALTQVVGGDKKSLAAEAAVDLLIEGLPKRSGETQLEHYRSDEEPSSAYSA